MELYYNFFVKLCDVRKFDELELVTDSRYLALAHEHLIEIWNEKFLEWVDKKSLYRFFMPIVQQIFFQELFAINM